MIAKSYSSYICGQDNSYFFCNFTALLPCSQFYCMAQSWNGKCTCFCILLYLFFSSSWHLLLKEFDPITLPEVIQLEELSVNSGHLSNSSICVLISFVTSLQWICCFFWERELEVIIKFILFLFLHDHLIYLMIHDKIHSEYFFLSCLKLFCGFFCNLLHFPGFPSAPPRAVFACPVEAWPSLHLNRHCLDRPKCIIYISMSRLHKLNSSLGNPAQKVTANTSQLRLSSRVFSWPV